MAKAGKVGLNAQEKTYYQTLANNIGTLTRQIDSKGARIAKINDTITKTERNAK